MRNKATSFVLSLFIAFGLWLYVITTVSPGYEDTFYNIPVAKVGAASLEEKNLMVTYQSSDNVDVTVSGNRTDVNKVNSSNITVKVELSAINEPGTMIPLNCNVSYPGDVPAGALTTTNRSPDVIFVTVEERREKPVPVEVVWIGSTPDGFMSDRENRVLDFSEITVIGPASVADLIEKAVVEVDLTEQRESIDQSYRYTLCDAEGNPVDAQMIKTNTEEVRVEVKIRRIQEVRFQLDVTYGGGANKSNTEITLDTNSIRVSGSEAALEALGDTIVLGKINLAEIPKNQQIPFTISLPEGVTNETGITEVMATVKFTGLGTREFAVEDIRSINVPEGVRVDLITEKLMVTLRGATADLLKIKEEDIHAVVDFNAAVVGESSTIYAQIVLEANSESVGPVGTYTVLATVEEE